MSDAAVIAPNARRLGQRRRRRRSTSWMCSSRSCVVVDVEVDDVRRRRPSAVGTERIEIRRRRRGRSKRRRRRLDVLDVDVDVLDEVVVEFERAVRCGRQTAAGCTSTVGLGRRGRVRSSVAPSAASDCEHRQSTATPRTASRTSGTARPPGIRRWAARAAGTDDDRQGADEQRRADRAARLGQVTHRIHGAGGRCRERDGADHSGAVTQLPLNCNEFAICVSGRSPASIRPGAAPRGDRCRRRFPAAARRPGRG